MSRIIGLIVLCAVAAHFDGMCCKPLSGGEPEKKISINAANIGRTVEIIGLLGKPIGTMMSLRGQWRPNDIPKGADLRFHVTHVDGNPLQHEVIYSGYFVTAANLEAPQNHGTKGVIWEMRAFEHAGFIGFEETNWEEFYGAPVQAPNSEQGHFVCSLAGNVKQEIRPTEKESQTRSDQPQKKISVQAADIGGKVQVIGRLGKPIGTMLMLRGEWRAPTDLSKPSGPEFHVTHVDGKPLPHEVVYSSAVVTAANLKNQRDQEVPGVVWEMRAFEDGRFVNLRELNWKDFYDAPPAQANYGQGPFVCFLTGNVKKETQPTRKVGSPKPK